MTVFNIHGNGSTIDTQPVYVTDNDYLGKSIEITPMNQMKIAPTVRLVGSSFVGNTIDSNFWTAVTSSAAAITQSNGEITLRTQTIANGSCSLQSVRQGRYVGGSSNLYRSITQTDNATGVTANTRRWGPFSETDGAFFQLSGSAFSVVTRKSGSDTVVGSSSFNTNAFTLDTNVHTYEIYWTNSKIYFTIDDILRHKISADSSTWTQTVTLPIRMENINYNGITTDIQLKTRVSTISRLGEAYTRPQWKNLAASSATPIVLKYGAGTLHTITVNTNGANGNALTIYDAVSATNQVAIINTANTNVSFVSYGISGLDFYYGLTVVLNGGATPANVTIVYE